MLPFPGLIIASPQDWDCAALADRHYPRRNSGSRQFLDVGKKLAIRNPAGSLVFGWVWSADGKRWDGQNGYYCSIFRNESTLRSSEVILQCEEIAFSVWGPNRMFTYVDPRKIQSRNPGYCFKMAGWKFVKITGKGKHLLVKEC